MQLYKLFLYMEIQGDFRVVYYDYTKEKRIEVNADDYSDKEISYLYVEDGVLYIEIDNEEESGK